KCVLFCGSTGDTGSEAARVHHATWRRRPGSGQKPKLTPVETFGTLDPASRRLALASRSLQKHFACRQQFTTTGQFDAWGLFRRDSKRVRISISAQQLPAIQLRRRANK